MTANLILLVLGLAAFHLVYEGIIAPSIRLELRYKLFAIRDRLRMLKIEDLEDDEVFEILQASLNTAISLLYRINIETVSSALRAFERDPQLRASAEKRMAILESCTVPEVQRIRAASAQVFGYALFTNTGGWFIYLLPVLLVVVLFGRLKRALADVLSTPEGQLRRVIPPENTVAA